MSELKTFYRHSFHYLAGRVAVMLLGFVSFPHLVQRVLHDRKGQIWISGYCDALWT